MGIWQGTAMGRGRRGAKWMSVAGVVAALVAVRGAADARPAGLAPTLSGFTSAPRSEGSIRIRNGGAGVRFRSPATTSITAIHTVWRRPTAGCRATLHDDAGGRPGAALVTAALPDGKTGWVEADLAAPVVDGHVYHVILTCDASGARLGYVRDADAHASRSGAWRLEQSRGRRMRLRRRPASPLFALVFADGRWWGQPYRPLRGRPIVRVCRSNEVSAVLVPRRPITVDDVRLRSRGAGPGFTLTSSDGRPMLAGQGDRASAPGAARPNAPATLEAGTAYTLRLGTPGRKGCFRQPALVTDLPLGPSLGGLDLVALRLSRDGGRTWVDAPPVTFAVRLLGTDAPLAGCGNARLDAAEQCDGKRDDACPGRCTDTCTCARLPAPPPTCGDGDVDRGEQCDGRADSACPGRCTTSCTCGPRVLPARAYRPIYASGYIGHYDSSTIAVWPKRLGLMLGEANAQGPLVQPGKQLAAESGNTDARFIFYLSLTDMDARCDCFDQRFYDSFRSQHPDWILRNASGSNVSTNNGIGRVFATDIGNLAYVDAWADWALAAADRYGWDGTFADNIFRGNFDGWSAPPINPRTGGRYTTAEYRADMLAAVRRIRARFDARGKIVVGNHTQAWEPDTFADPITKAEVTALGGVEIEDCVYDWSDRPHSEANWIAQLQYFDFANRHGVRTVCQGRSATGNPSRRTYVLASYLLTKEGFSSISELNSLSDWWSGLETDLGAPRGGFTCLDPAVGLAPAADCPSRGKIYARDWDRGFVLVNPSDGATVTVPLSEDFLDGNNRVRSVTLGPHSGIVLRRP